MERTTTPDADQRLDRVVATILLVGVILAASIVLLGGIVFLVRGGNATFAYETFRGEPAGLRTVSGILGEACTFGGQGLIQLGLLVLIATPVVRVLFLVFAFAARRDRTFVIITLVVLANLLLGLAGVFA